MNIVDVPEIEVEQLEREASGGAFVLDVRHLHEYEEGHIAGSRLIPLPELPDRLTEIPEGEPIFVICRTSGRSRRATEFLRQQGVEATLVSGGMIEWIDSERPVVEGSEST
jgi:rhodanese-related sulfurtransferase